MARINTNIPSIIAQANLSRSSSDLALRLQRLSTGLRINRGADDPSGLIISERLRSEIQAGSRKVRLGITAPFHIAVHRKEIYDAIKGENLEAARLSLPRSELSLSAPFNKGGTRPSIVTSTAKLRNRPAVGRTAGSTGTQTRH